MCVWDKKAWGGGGGGKKTTQDQQPGSPEPLVSPEL